MSAEKQKPVGQDDNPTLYSNYQRKRKNSRNKSTCLSAFYGLKASFVQKLLYKMD